MSSLRISAESSTTKTRTRVCAGSLAGCWSGSRSGVVTVESRLESSLAYLNFADAALPSSLARSARTRSRSNGLTIKSIAPSRIESINDCF